MRARQSQRPKQAATPKSPLRVLFYFGLAVAVFIVGLGTIGGLIFYKRINRLQKIEASASEAYVRVEKAYPFDPAAHAQGQATVFRVDDYLKARDALLRELTPEVRTDLEAALDAQGASPAKLLWRLQGNIDFLERASNNHVAALEASKMGITEYLWLHGLAMRDAARAKGERWKQFSTILVSLRGIAESVDKNSVKQLDAAEIERKLNEWYAGIESPDTLLDPAVRESKSVGLLDALFLIAFTNRGEPAPLPPPGV